MRRLNRESGADINTISLENVARAIELMETSNHNISCGRERGREGRRKKRDRERGREGEREKRETERERDRETERKSNKKREQMDKQ